MCVTFQNTLTIWESWSLFSKTINPPSPPHHKPPSTFVNVNEREHRTSVFLDSSNQHPVCLTSLRMPERPFPPCINHDRTGRSNENSVRFPWGGGGVDVRSNPGGVKPMTYTINKDHYPASCFSNNMVLEPGVVEGGRSNCPPLKSHRVNQS